jgi:hypothetical protein
MREGIDIYSDNAPDELFWNGNGWNKRDDLRVIQKLINRL